MGKSKEKKKKLETQNTQYEEETKDNDKPIDDDVTTFSDKKKKKKKNREKITVKIETIRENPDKISPIIGYFSSRIDPLNGNGDSQAKVKVYKNVKRSNRYEVVVSPHESQVEFVGTNYSGEGAAPQMCTYALGVLDKSTHTLKIVPITANKIFRLVPRVAAGVDQPENEPQDAEKPELTEEQKAKKMENYLSKPTVRKLHNRALLRQHDDPETRQDIDRKIEGFKMNEEALEVSSMTTNSRNIPPHNMDAKEADMAYPLDKIIFKGEWDHLLDILYLSQGGADVETGVYPSFVCNRVYKLDHIKDEMKKSELAGILSYITHLIKFKDKHSMDGISSAKRHKIPGLLFQKFSSMFGDSSLKMLANDKRDLLISYVLVLTLFVDDFRTDPTDIAADLRMSAMKLRPYYELLGCKIVRENQVSLATLPVPLEFRNASRKRKGRGS